jgi:hypothetical protein
MPQKQNIILDLLNQLQAQYIEAHHPGHDNTFSWLGIDFFVDQMRHIIMPLAPLEGEWQTNDAGMIFAINKPLLFLNQPDSRDLPVTYFQRILAEMLQEPQKTKLVPHRLGYFLTLMVAEVTYNPLALTTTFLTVLKAIEQQQTQENIFDLLPGLLIDAATANLSEEDLHAYKQTNMTQQITLMQEVRPNIVAEMDALLRDNSMETTIDIIKNRLLTDLQTKIFFG